MPLNAYRLRLFCGYGDRLQGTVLEVDRLEVLNAFFGNVVADHAVALSLELFHIDIHAVEGPGAVGDDPGIEQGLDQHAEYIGRLFHVLAADFVGGDLLDFSQHAGWVEPELNIKIDLFRRRHQIEQQDLEAVRRPILDDIVLGLAELRDRAVGPDLAELMVEGSHEIRDITRF